MKNLKVLLIFVTLIAGVLTSCTKQELNEENFQGVDKDVQRPGSQGDNSNDSSGG